ncbi:MULTISPECIES: TetR/AcrR family transcriptional regulator [Bradyrhizobium]|uniref:TetR/AcrR family transcriptional regulator n=1 Tax=Bradyrhizobium vignae TaxID=1549949 RepID=A0A2U3PW78_9BRAD|nr:TetR/AcrR family transcriptional regulator [Bradyrhizobium vignae]MBP0113422.1 TetR/AcrR family transcriptional regulator [Bradyrhizobium vignae]SPP93384.1 Transcriptional regulatory protein [Bradyrhizobium vignae]
MKREHAPHLGRHADVRDRIVQAAVELYCEIGHNKTTVADVARRLSMSSANIYRFFPSKRAIEEAVVERLLDEMVGAAADAARGGGPALGRIAAVLKAMADCNESRPAKHRRLQDLVALAVRQNWPVVLVYSDRIRGLVRPMIGAGQARGEVQGGSPMALTCCLLDAMDIHLNPSRMGAATLRPSFEEMSKFCMGALSRMPSRQPVEMTSQVHLKAAG